MFEFLSFAINGLLRTVGLTEPADGSPLTGEQRERLELLVARYPSIANNRMNDMSGPAIEFLRGLRGTGRLTDRRGRHVAIATVEFIGPNEWDAETLDDLVLAKRLAAGDPVETDRIQSLRVRRWVRLRNRQGPHGLAHSLLNWSGVQSAFHTLTHFGYRLPNLHREIGSPGVDHYLTLLGDLFPTDDSLESFDVHWRTRAALDFANHIYGSDDYSQLPILADLLEEAGCDDAAVLGHCRGPDVHIRGCWVVDLVLGKA